MAERERVLPTAGIPLLYIVALCALITQSLVDHGGVSDWQPLILLPALAWMTTTLLSGISKETQNAGSSSSVSNRGCLTQRLTWPVPICMGILALGYFQTLNLNYSILSTIAPGSASIYRDWVPERIIEAILSSRNDAASNIVRSRLTAAPISVSPWDTRLAIAGVLSFTLTLITASSMSWTLNRLKVVLGFLTIAGVFLSIFGVADQIVLTREWQPELRARLLITPVGADSPFGTFINSNNAAGFLHLCIGAAIGLATLEDPSSRRSSVGLKKAITIFALITMVIGVLSTESRGAIFALILGGSAITLKLARKRQIRKILLGSVLIIPIILLFLQAIGTSGSVGDRLLTLFDGRILANPRFSHWVDATTAGMHFVPFGSGLGSYRYAYLPFQSDASARWYVNADGMPFEWLVEGGIILITLLAISLFCVISDLRKLGPLAKAANQNEEVRCLSAIANLFLYTLPVILVTQSLDFGITLPSLYLTLAILIGILVSKSKESRHQREAAAPVRFRRRFLCRIVMILLLATMTIDQLRIRTCHLKLQTLDRQSAATLRGSVEGWRSYASELSTVDWACNTFPYSSENRRIRSNLLIRDQQWRGARSLVGLERDTNPRQASVNPNQFSLRTLRKVVNEQKLKPRTYSFQDSLLPNQQEEAFEQAFREAAIGLVLAPLDDRMKIRLIELDYVIDDPTVTKHLIQRVRQLREGDKNINRYLDALVSDRRRN